MKIVRFIYQRKLFWGRLAGETVTLLADQPFDKIKFTRRKLPLKKVRLLAPTAPSKIILTGLNYRDHARELKMPIPQEPLIFLKPNTTVIGPGAKIIYPHNVQRLDYEAELAVVIGKRARFIPQQKAAKYILGYTCLNDVTARDLQKKDIQWTRAKSFDSFCPVGPWIETELNPQDLKISLYLNARLRQNSSTRNLIFSVDELVAFVSGIMTVLPGDVISTGTPPGVGSMQRGDRVSVEIEGVGRLDNRVA
ncbi:MAG: fumarylacetoacetate hydrolase family protein [Candidatus Omnitrophica bacterium]|nr:fumarylacetoacetate hydrolase family protein [Candidatus Omnitrophota bacterium]